MMTSTGAIHDGQRSGTSAVIIVCANMALKKMPKVENRQNGMLLSTENKAESELKVWCKAALLSLGIQ